MIVHKFFLIKRENSERNEIVHRSKIFIEEKEDGKLVYNPVITAESYNDEDIFVILQGKKPVHVEILGNEDSTDKLMGSSKSNKRTIQKKKFSISPDVMSKSRQKTELREKEAKETMKEKKRLSAAKKDVIYSADGLFANEVMESEIQQTDHQPIQEQKLPDDAIDTSPVVQGSLKSLCINYMSSSEAEDSDVEIPKGIAGASSENNMNTVKGCEPNLQKNSQNLSNSLSPLYYGPEDLDLMVEANFQEVLAKNTSGEMAQNAKLGQRLGNSAKEANFQGVIAKNTSKGMVQNAELEQRSENLTLAVGNNFQRVTAKDTSRGMAQNAKLEQPSEKSHADQQKTENLFSDKVEVLSGIFIEKDCYEKAKIVTDIKARVTNIINGFWSDEEAARLCLKPRVDHSHLQEVSQMDLANITAIFNKINKEKPVKQGKKIINTNFTAFLRQCCSENFKIRRQKLKKAREIPGEDRQISKKRGHSDDEIDIDSRIEELIEKKRKIQENKKLKSCEQSTKADLEDNKIKLLKKTEELEKRDQTLEERRKKFQNYLKHLNVGGDENQPDNVDK